MSMHTAMRDRLLAQDGIIDRVPDAQMEPIRVYIRRNKRERRMINVTSISCWFVGFTLLVTARIISMMTAASEEMGNLSFKHETSFGPEVYNACLWSGLAVLFVGLMLSMPSFFKAQARRKAITRLGAEISTQGNSPKET